MAPSDDLSNPSSFASVTKAAHESRQLAEVLMRLSELEEKLDAILDQQERIFALVKHIQMRVDNQTSMYFPGSS